MTNSLFETRETKTERERHKEMEQASLLVVLSEQRAETSPFPRSYSILDESCWTTKTKGAGTSQATVAGVYSGCKKKRRRRTGGGLLSKKSLRSGRQCFKSSTQEKLFTPETCSWQHLTLSNHIFWILQQRSLVLISCQYLIFFGHLCTNIKKERNIPDP